MKEQSALIIGASGLIGSHILEQILSDNDFSSVRILVRTNLPVQHPKLQQYVVDFNNIDDLSHNFGTGDVIFCCIGTTQKKVGGDKSAYKKVDLDIALKAAQMGVSNGFKKFLIVSSAGADAASSNFYLSLKGEIENEIRKFAFKSICIFRPSMLLGKRKERRRGEKIMQVITQGLSFLFICSLKKYHPVRANVVAKAMIAESKLNNDGVHILHYKEMMQLITPGQHRQ